MYFQPGPLMYRNTDTHFSHLFVSFCLYVTCHMLSQFSRVWLWATLWTVDCQAPLSTGFPRQGYWSGLPCLPPGGLPDPGIEPVCLTSPALAGRFFTTGATSIDTYMHIHTHILYSVLSFVFIFYPKIDQWQFWEAVMHRSTSLFLLMSQNPMLWRDHHFINHPPIHVSTDLLFQIILLWKSLHMYHYALQTTSCLLFQIILLWKSLHMYHYALQRTSWKGNVWSNRTHILHFD